VENETDPERIKAAKRRFHAAVAHHTNNANTQSVTALELDELDSRLRDNDNDLPPVASIADAADIFDVEGLQNWEIDHLKVRRSLYVYADNGILPPEYRAPMQQYYAARGVRWSDVRISFMNFDPPAHFGFEADVPRAVKDELERRAWDSHIAYRNANRNANSAAVTNLERAEARRVDASAVQLVDGLPRVASFHEAVLKLDREECRVTRTTYAVNEIAKSMTRDHHNVRPTVAELDEELNADARNEIVNYFTDHGINEQNVTFEPRTTDGRTIVWLSYASRSQAGKDPVIQLTRDDVHAFPGHGIPLSPEKLVPVQKFFADRGVAWRNVRATGVDGYEDPEIQDETTSWTCWTFRADVPAAVQRELQNMTRASIAARNGVRARAAAARVVRQRR
jgi:hypothetical protein